MDELQRFTNLKDRITKLTGDKIRLEERYKSEREKLEKILKEITDKGYDPTKLAEIKAAKESELKKTLDELETLTNDISNKLIAIESGNV